MRLAYLFSTVMASVRKTAAMLSSRIKTTIEAGISENPVNHITLWICRGFRLRGDSMIHSNSCMGCFLCYRDSWMQSRNRNTPIPMQKSSTIYSHKLLIIGLHSKPQTWTVSGTIQVDGSFTRPVSCHLTLVGDTWRTRYYIGRAFSILGIKVRSAVVNYSTPLCSPGSLLTRFCSQSSRSFAASLCTAISTRIFLIFWYRNIRNTLHSYRLSVLPCQYLTLPPC